MEPVPVLIAAGVAAVVLCVLLLRLAGRERHKMTRAGLRNRALEEAEALVALIEAREATRPADDTVVKESEYPHRRVTLHDEETQRIYARDHLPLVADLRGQFARRGVRNRSLDAFYEAPENEADLRTVSTALEEMARRLG
jgi:hypothetical protein